MHRIIFLDMWWFARAGPHDPSQGFRTYRSRVVLRILHFT